VFASTVLHDVSEKLTWTTCLSVIAETIQYIAGTVYVEAICHIEPTSGIPEYPISGNVVFAQLVMTDLSEYGS